MTVEFPNFADLEPGLARAALPVWVVDTEIWKFLWSNAHAQVMWRAPDPGELEQRDVQSNTPDKVLTRINAMIERVRRGESVREEWTFFPRGQAMMVMLELSGVRMPDGRFGLLNQALPITDMAPATQRAVTIARHSATINAFVSPAGDMLSQNPSAIAVFGERDSWLSWFDEREPAEQLLARALAGERVRDLIQVKIGDAQRWHFVDAHALRDPVSGERGVLVEHVDETARIEAEQLAEMRGLKLGILSETLELVEQQRREILSLSAPILDVGEHKLAVPIIGQLGAEQGESLMLRLLDAVARRGARRVILDLTGAADIDRRSAQRLQSLIRSLQLLGAQVTITGVRAQLALELAAADIDFDGIATLATLAEGLRSRG